MELDDLRAIRPNPDWGPFSIAVGLELIEAVLALWLFAFDDDVRCRRRIFFKYHDVGSFFMHRRTEVHWLL